MTQINCRIINNVFLKSIISCLITFCLIPAQISCKKDIQPDEPGPSDENIVVLQEVLADGKCDENVGQPLFLRLYDGSFAMAWNDYDAGTPYLAKYSSAGALCWKKQISGSSYRLTSLDTASVGTYVLAMNSTIKDESRVMKFNANGDSVWVYRRSFGMEGAWIKMASTGEIVTAFTEKDRPSVLVLSAQGDSLRSFNLGDSLSHLAYISCLVEVSMLGWVGCWNYESPSGQPESVVFNFGLDGSINNIRKFPGYAICDLNVNSDESLLCSAFQSLNNHILTISANGSVTLHAATTESQTKTYVLSVSNGWLLAGNMALYKFDLSGNKLWARQYYSDVMQSYIFPVELALESPGTYILFGYRRIINGGYVPLVLRFTISA